MLQTQNRVRIVEVGPRDGLQNVPIAIPTPTKIELIQRLRGCGLSIIELTSAVSPKAVPQLADNVQVLSSPEVQDVLRDTNVQAPVLVPNTKGLEVAIKHGVREVAVFVSATEGFSKKNTNCTVAEGIERARAVAVQGLKAGLRIRGYISCIFQDPYEGSTPLHAVLQGVQSLLDMGCYEVSLGDTTGVGTASNVSSLLKYLMDNGIPPDKLAGHFHDTYGQAVSNVWSAYQLGLRTFDSSVGGLGGCPFAPGAKGNVATEDIAYLFQQAGIDTGIDISKLAETGAWISTRLAKLNDSRAGAALQARRPLNASSPRTVDQHRHMISWQEQMQSSDELKIYYSKPNVKLVLNRPKNGNALTEAMIKTLTEFFELASKDSTITRIVITANGKFFCTGMDLSKSNSPVAKSDNASSAQFDRLTRLFEAIDKAPQVTIAALNGPAFGGGVGLAFACDIRLGASKATVTLSEAKLGLCPATISKYVLREWPLAFAREAMLSGRTIPLSELLELGVVTRTAQVDDLDLAIDQYLASLKVSAPRASTLCKELGKLSTIGGQVQADGIRAAFDEMMRADAEGAFGLKKFQAGRKSIDWDAYVMAKTKAKL